MANEHLKREIADLHKDGCIWRHEGGYGTFRNTGCHYRKNGFEAGNGRKDMYNKDHRDAAVRLGYADWGPDQETIVPKGGTGSRFEAELAAGAKNRSGGALDKFLQKFRGKFTGSLKWLEYDAEGWHYGFRDTRHPVHGAVEPTFKPKDKDTSAHGAWYPYHHEYHHLIAVDALRQHVITDKDVDRRTETLLATGWNINKGENVVCLPTELSTAAIVELPAHCPWDEPSHPDYSSSLADHLKGTAKMLDDAMKKQRETEEKDCLAALNKISQELDKVAKKLLKKIERQAGEKLGAVPGPGSTQRVTT